MRAKALWLSAGAVLVLIGLSRLVPAEPPASPPADGDAALQPKWQVGQKWVVETANQLVQSGSDSGGKLADQGAPVQWEFTVQEPEQLGGKKCHRVSIRCLVEGGRQQPVAAFWADQDTLALKQIQTQLPVQGQFRTVTESYQFAEGQPSPVLGPLSAIPLDMPLFLPGKTKDLGEFTYEAVQGPAGQKAADDVGFSVGVKQRIKALKADDVKGLLDKDFAKGLKDEPVYEVRLETNMRSVRQLWQPGKPWPSYSSNGSTVCRLTKLIPPQ